MNTSAIASHLNIASEAIIKIEEWANVLWVKFVGGCRFVSKKVTEMKKTRINSAEAAQILSQKIGGKIWDRKEGETRLYIGKGYLRFAPATETTHQWQTYLKSYDFTNSIKTALDLFDNQYLIVAATDGAKVVETKVITSSLQLWS